MPKTLAFLGLGLLGVCTSIAGDSSTVIVNLQPAEVTVYPKGARIMAEGKATAQKGELRVSFPNLPTDAREDSLRLAVEGPPGTKLYEAKIKSRFWFSRPQRQARVPLGHLSSKFSQRPTHHRNSRAAASIQAKRYRRHFDGIRPQTPSRRSKSTQAGTLAAKASIKRKGADIIFISSEVS